MQVQVVLLAEIEKEGGQHASEKEAQQGNKRERGGRKNEREGETVFTVDGIYCKTGGQEDWKGGSKKGAFQLNAAGDWPSFPPGQDEYFRRGGGGMGLLHAEPLHRT